ncbi:MAG: PAS domain S-box protein [Clostridiales bacterium]|nr:PAS domain S-box protein [Clostridiales bacterium]
METDKTCLISQVNDRTSSGCHDVVATVLNAVEALIVVLDLSGRIVIFNKRCEQLTGYTFAEVQGKDFRDILVIPEEKDKVGHDFSHVCASQFPSECESHWVTKSGEVHYIAWTSHGLPDKNGNIELIVSTGIDITTSKQTESALWDSEELFRELFNSANDAIFLCELTDQGLGKYLSVNNIAIQKLGYTNEEFLRMTPLTIPVVEKEKRDNLAQNFPDSSGSAFELTLIAKNGKEIPFELSVQYIHLQGKNIAMAVCRDITERKAMEEETLKTSKLESVGALAGSIAHDFNNILTVFLGNLSMARMFVKHDEKISSKLQDMEDAAMEGKALARRLLTFARGGEPIKRIFEVSALLDNVGGRALCGDHVKCVYEISMDILPVEVDEGQITQVINDILLNAIDSMSGRGTIFVQAGNVKDHERRHFLKDGPYVKIAVTDEGPGIPPDNLSRVFDPFFTTKDSHSGLGLATAFSVVHKHQGFITVESIEGFGPTFTIYLPAVAVIAEESSGTDTTGNGKILVMDDELYVRKMAGEMLEVLGYKPDLAADGEEAYTMYRKAREAGEPFHAVIMDLSVSGGIGGKEAVQKVLAYDPQAKVIVSSGYYNDPVMSDYTCYGFKGCLEKPYTMKELHNVLQRLLQEA